MNVTQADILVTSFWTTLIDDDYTQIAEYYNTNPDWKELLDSEEVLRFLEARFRLKPVQTFTEIEMTPNFDVISLLDDQDDLDNFFYENEDIINSWAVIQALKANRYDLLTELQNCQDWLDCTPLELNLCLFTLGECGTKVLANCFLDFDVCEDITEESGWAPIALGLTMADNIQMFKYLYRDMLAEQYYNTSEYYSDWTHTCEMMTQLFVSTEECKIKAYFEKL